MINSDQLAHMFDLQWGSFRRWIAANPLSGFWTGVAVGAGLLYLLARLTHQIIS